MRMTASPRILPLVAAALALCSAAPFALAADRPHYVHETGQHLPIADCVGAGIPWPWPVKTTPVKLCPDGSVAINASCADEGYVKDAVHLARALAEDLVEPVAQVVGEDVATPVLP